jgi:hypothetical protein
MLSAVTVFACVEGAGEEKERKKNYESNPKCLKIPRTYGTRYWGFKFTLAPLPQKNFNA